MHIPTIFLNQKKAQQIFPAQVVQGSSPVALPFRKKFHSVYTLLKLQSEHFPTTLIPSNKLLKIDGWNFAASSVVKSDSVSAAGALDLYVSSVRDFCFTNPTIRITQLTEMIGLSAPSIYRMIKADDAFLDCIHSAATLEWPTKTVLRAASFPL